MSFLGPLVPLFWISGDVSSGLQSQRGSCLILIVEANVMYVLQDPRFIFIYFFPFVIIFAVNLMWFMLGICFDRQITNDRSTTDSSFYLTSVLHEISKFYSSKIHWFKLTRVCLYWMSMKRTNSRSIINPHSNEQPFCSTNEEHK